MMKIAYLHRISFEESEERFLEEAQKKGVEMVAIKYRQLSLRDGRIFFGSEDLAGFDLWYCRGVGSELEWAKLLEGYAKKLNKPVVDEYLLGEGPLRRFKSVAGTKLIEAGVNYPKTVMVESLVDLERELADNWKLPVVVKLSQGGRHGMGTFWIRRKEDLGELKEKLSERKQLAVAEGRKKPDFRSFLIQPYISNNGDYRVMTVGYKCVGGFKRKQKEEKLVMNKSLGKSEALNRVPEDVVREAEKAAKALGVEVAGTDLIQDSGDGKVYVVEVNEAPQFKVFEKRTKINVVGKIIDYLVEKAEDR